MSNRPSPSGRRAFLVTTIGMAASLAMASSRLLSAGPAATTGATARPEDFGARGDGRTDDTAAFQALGAAVSSRGGGVIALRRGATYRLGRQSARSDTGAMFGEQPMLLLQNVKNVVIQGNGAVLKLNDNLRYGSFDPVTGEPFTPPDKGDFKQQSYAAVVGKIVEIKDGSGIQISNLVLDGNVDRVLVGGRWGDVEIQLAATGLQFTRVSEATVEDVVTRDNGLDGIYLYGRNTATTGGEPDNITFRRVRSERNGRQGMSIVGGKGLRFEQCTFSDTAQGPVASRPRAGVDIEPNGHNWASDVSFENCVFTNNLGVGLLADKGGSSDLTVRDCTFWQGFNPLPGVTKGSGDAFWLTREGILIDGCQVHGSVSQLAVSAQVRRSVFDDAAHPVLGRSAQRRPYLLDGVGGTFENCSFDVEGPVPIGLVSCKQPIVFRGCRMRFAATARSPNRAAAVFSAATTLQDVSFTEGAALSGGARYILGGGARLLGVVQVSGPNVRWNGKNGPTGNIAPQ